MQARYYDPVIGRFYSNDPVGFTGDITSFNRYSYVGNNPYKYTDPDGQNRLLVMGARLAKNPTRAPKMISRAVRSFAEGLGILSPVMNEGSDQGTGPNSDVPDGDEAVDYDPEVDTLETGNNRAGEPRVKITKGDGSVVDMTGDRIKKDVPEPRNPNGGDKPHKWNNPQAGSKGKKRDPTPNEKEFIKKHGEN